MHCSGGPICGKGYAPNYFLKECCYINWICYCASQAALFLITAPGQPKCDHTRVNQKHAVSATLPTTKRFCLVKKRKKKTITWELSEPFAPLYPITHTHTNPPTWRATSPSRQLERVLNWQTFWLDFQNSLSWSHFSNQYILYWRTWLTMFNLKSPKTWYKDQILYH